MASEAVKGNGRYANIHDVELVIETKFSIADVTDEKEENGDNLRACESHRDGMSDRVGP